MVRTRSGRAGASWEGGRGGERAAVGVADEVGRAIELGDEVVDVLPEMERDAGWPGLGAVADEIGGEDVVAGREALGELAPLPRCEASAVDQEGERSGHHCERSARRIEFQRATWIGSAIRRLAAA